MILYVYPYDLACSKLVVHMSVELLALIPNFSKNHEFAHSCVSFFVSLGTLGVSWEILACATVVSLLSNPLNNECILLPS